MTKSVVKAFEEIKEKLTTTLVIHLSDFSKAFEVACDAFDVGIGCILSQESHPIVFLARS